MSRLLITRQLPSIWAGDNGATANVGGWEWNNTVARPEFGGVGPLTVCCWICPYDGEAGDMFSISTGQGGGGTNRMGVQFRHHSTHKFRFQAKFSSTVGRWESATDTFPAADDWYHVAVTYDIQDDTTIDPVFYLDGKVIAIDAEITPVGEASNIAGTDNLNVLSGWGGVEFGGQMADFALWRGEFLTPVEIALLAEGYVRPGEVRPDLLLSWVDCSIGIDIIRPELVALVSGGSGVCAIGTIPPKLLNWELLRRRVIAFLAAGAAPPSFKRLIFY